jgi:hypothetical protein
MLAKTTGGGICLAFPDVCLTPTPAGPVPIPYPNIGADPTDVGFVPNVLVTCTPAHNMMTTAPMTNGDNAGVAHRRGLGARDGATSGTSSASVTVIVGSAPMTRLTSPTIQNSTNSLRASSSVPSVTNVLVLAP